MTPGSSRQAEQSVSTLSPSSCTAPWLISRRASLALLAVSLPNRNVGSACPDSAQDLSCLFHVEVNLGL